MTGAEKALLLTVARIYRAQMHSAINTLPNRDPVRVLYVQDLAELNEAIAPFDPLPLPPVNQQASDPARLTVTNGGYSMVFALDGTVTCTCSRHRLVAEKTEVKNGEQHYRCRKCQSKASVLLDAVPTVFTNPVNHGRGTV